MIATRFLLACVLLVPLVERFLCLERCLGAEIIRITADNYDSVVPVGKEVDAIIGDWVIRNGRLVAVIAQPAEWRHANLTIRNVGGCLLDLTVRGAENDQLGVLMPLGNRYVYRRASGNDGRSWIEIAADDVVTPVDPNAPDAAVAVDGNRVELRFRSNGAADGSYCRLTYRLDDRASELEIETLVVNPTGTEIRVPLRDAMRADRTFADGIDSAGTTAASPVFWVQDASFRQAYAVRAEGYEPNKAEGRGPIVDWSRDGDSTLAVPADGSAGFTRRIAVAEHRLALRDVVRREAFGDRDAAPLERFELNVIDGWGSVGSAEVVLANETGIWGDGTTDADGWVRGGVPGGTWTARVSALGRGKVEKVLTLPSELPLVVELPSSARVQLAVQDDDGQPIPFKASFFGIEGTSDPQFGPDSRAWASGNAIYSAGHPVMQDLPPGKYEMVVSHGTEHDAEVRTISVDAGSYVEIDVELPHVVDSTGWISADFHSHSSPSGDNTSDPLGRVLNLLAERIEFAPCTEHARIDSYVPHLQRLGALGRMATCSGMELTGSPLPVNHQNAFPLTFRPRTQNGGGPETDLDPIVQIERLAMWEDGSDKVVQGNHPNIRQIYGDANADGEPDAGLGRMLGFMDVIEVHPPESIFRTPGADRKPSDADPVMFHWMQLLNLGHRIPGVVNTDAHYNFHGSGWLRNYVRSSADDPAEISIDEMVRNIEAGRIVMTTGPFLEVVGRSGEAAAIPGEDLVAVDGKVDLYVRVQCPNWFDIDRVQLFVNGRPADEFGWRRRTDSEAFGNGTVRFERRFDVPIATDAHLIVATIDEEGTLGRVMGPTGGKLPPVAVSNPIFVDADGNGFEPNGDDLDHPLPVLAR